MAERILIVDDEQSIRNLASRILSRQGYEIDTRDSGEQALNFLAKNPVDLLLTDIKMPSMTGIELLEKARGILPELAAVIITGHGTIEMAIEALKQGAHGFVMKPFTPQELLDGIDKALSKSNLLKENIRLRALLPLYEATSNLISEPDLPRLLKKIVDLIKNETSADRISIMLLNNESSELEVVAAIGFNDDISQLSKITMGQGISGWVAKNARPIVISGQNKSELDPGISIDNPEIASSVSLPIMTGGTTLGVLNISYLKKRRNFTQSELDQLSILCAQAAVAIENTRLYKDLEDSYFGMVRALCRAMEAKDSYTRGHSERVSRYAEQMGNHLKLTAFDMEKLHRASLLHDIGKIGVPDAILHKPSGLTEIEVGEIKLHPSIGARIIGVVPGLRDVEDIIMYHHSFYDGSKGNIKGEDIPLLARILTIADSFDAMTSQRPYNEPLSYDQALTEIKASAGKQFDPDLVEIFEKVIKEIECIPSDV